MEVVLYAYEIIMNSDNIYIKFMQNAPIYASLREQGCYFFVFIVTSVIENPHVQNNYN